MSTVSTFSHTSGKGLIPGKDIDYRNKLAKKLVSFSVVIALNFKTKLIFGLPI